MAHVRRAQSSSDPGQDRALASNVEEPHPCWKTITCRRLEACIGKFVEYYITNAYHEKLEKPHAADVYFGRGKPSC